MHTALRLPGGYTLMVALPTGGGKSLITQIVAAQSNGLTVVIVPTVALALDQYRAARTTLELVLNEDEIAYYHGQVKPAEATLLFRQITDGKLRLLFTSPEAVLRNASLRDALQSVADRQQLNNLVIDEAHIVDDWGALFRPDFQFLSVFRKDLLRRSEGRLRTILLSATLTRYAVQTLRNLYSEVDRWVEVRCDALRSEPRYHLVRCTSEREKRERIVTACKLLPRPMILYVLSPDDAEDWQRLLSVEGFTNHVVFTGDTEDDERDRIITAWNQDELDLVIATSAFGMGVDKADVRTVIHACIPESLNRFYQEVGRGGRDGLPSLSLMCVQVHEDGEAAFSLTNKRVITTEKLVKRWASMLHGAGSFVEGDRASLDTSIPPSYFKDEAKEVTGRRNVQWNVNVLLFLCRYGLLDLLNIDYRSKTNSYYVDVRLKKLDLLVNPERLFDEVAGYRETELEYVLSGFTAMKALVDQSSRQCWAKAFVEIYDYAEEVCGGCSTHDEPYLPRQGFGLQKRLSWTAIPGTREAALSHLMGAYCDLWIRRSKGFRLEWAEASALARAVNHYGLSVWIVPETPDATLSQDFRGLVLTADEFFYTLDNHPSLLRTGVFCCMGQDDAINQRMFSQLWRLRDAGTPVAFYGDDMMVSSTHGKSMRNIIEGYILDSIDIVEG